jgi:hypothetical protein
MPFGLFALLLCPLDYLLSCYDLWIIYSLVMPFGLFAPKDIYLVFHKRANNPKGITREQIIQRA